MVEEFNNNIYEMLFEFINEFFYDENIYVVYLMYGNKKGVLSYQFGFCLEYIGIKIELKIIGEVNECDFLNFFFSVNLGYEFLEEKSFQFSYSCWISCFSFWSLNLFFIFLDDCNFWGGNFDFNLEFSYNFEFGFLWIFEWGSLFFVVYYCCIIGVIECIQCVNFDGISIICFENLVIQDNYGFEFNVNYKLVVWLKVNGDFNLFQEIVDGGEEFFEFWVEIFIWFIRVIVQFDIIKCIEG